MGTSPRTSPVGSLSLLTNAGKSVLENATSSASEYRSVATRDLVRFPTLADRQVGSEGRAKLIKASQMVHPDRNSQQ